MTNHVRNHFLRRMLTVFGEPKTDNVEAFLGEYERALGGYTEESLKRGADAIINGNTFKAWPTPGKCREAIEANVPRAEPNYELSEPAPPPLSEEERKRANELADSLRSFVDRTPVVAPPTQSEVNFSNPKLISEAQRQYEWNAYVQRRERAWFERHKDAIRAKMVGQE